MRNNIGYLPTSISLLPASYLYSGNDQDHELPSSGSNFKGVFMDLVPS
jgi:hypothetical protein